MSWTIKSVGMVRFIPKGDDSGNFIPLKNPIKKLVLKHELGAEIIITKGTSFTVKNPPVKKPQYIETGRGKVINRWAESVQVPGPISVFCSRMSFENYVKERFGQLTGQQIVDALTCDFRSVR